MRPAMKPLKPLDEALADLLAHAQLLPGSDTCLLYTSPSPRDS